MVYYNVVVKNIVEELYGPVELIEEGNNSIATYEADGLVIQAVAKSSLDTTARNQKKLSNYGIRVPETSTYKLQDVNLALVVQEKLEDPTKKLYEDPKDFVDQCWEFANKAASNYSKLDFDIRNFGLKDDLLYYHDIQDQESVWYNEPRPYHMMSSHLKDSIKQLEQVQGAPPAELKELAETWWNIR